MRYVKESDIAASAAAVFGFHERPDALARLTPPWQRTEIVVPPASLAVGTRVVLRVRLGPLWQTIEAEHVEYEPGRMFADRMVRGPFRKWLHRHIVTPLGPARCRLSDDIELELPGGRVAEIVAGAAVRHQLGRLFAFRHDVTRRACELAGPPA